MKRIAACLAICVCGLASGCRATSIEATTVNKAPAEQSPAVEPASQDHLVRLAPESLRQITVGQTGGTTAPHVLTMTGKVQFNEDHIARILPPVTGQVQELKVQVGDRVQAGQVLFLLNSREVAGVFAEHTSAHKDLDLAEKTYAMTQDLFDHQAASKLSLQQADNEMGKATARVQQSEQVLHVLGVDMPDDGSTAVAPRVPVRSRLTGVVTQRAVTEGQFVDTQTEPLLTIADLSTVWVVADAFERDLSSISRGQRAEVTTAAYPNARFVARVAQIGNVVDPATHTITVRFLVSNPGASLKPGMFATSTLHLDESPPGLTVPSKAVFMEDGKSFSYVEVSDRAFARREVATTPDAADLVRVISGLRPGERVVTDGVLLLRQRESEAQP